MPEPPAPRASDADREQVAAHLRQAAGEGRLDTEELEERVAGAYRARTQSELLALVDDLPPMSSRGAATSSERSVAHRRLRRLGPYVGVNLLLVATWAATTGAREPVLGVVEAPEFFWPAVSILAWGAGIGLSYRRERREAAPPRPGGLALGPAGR